MKENLEGGRVKGGIIRTHLDWLQAKLGESAIEKLKPHVSEATARLLSLPVLPGTWYPFRAVVEIDRAIAKVVGRPERDVVEELGAHSARVNLGTAYKAFHRERPHEFFKQSAILHTRFQDFGRAVYEELGPTSCRMSMVDYPCYSKTFCWSAIGFYRTATELEGGHSACVVEEECVNEGGTACRFVISWS